jgi:hypothetical protein
MAFHLNFLNKNIYRRYPLRYTTNESVIPNSFISAIQISTIFTYKQLYISKLYFVNKYLSITISDTNTLAPLGCFSGLITKNYQNLILIPFIPEISGSLTTGVISLSDSVLTVEIEDGRLEDSTIFCFTPPAVTKIVTEKDVVGNIVIAGNNINVINNGTTITLSVINKLVVKSNNDKFAEYGNCNTPLITSINTVLPNSSGNIDIYAIDPMRITIVKQTIQIGTANLTLNDVCPARVKLSPIPGGDEYYTNIVVTSTPEWKTWPQFNPS